MTGHPDLPLSIEVPGIIAPALCAGLLVAATHVPLGREVLKRGIIFLDLAVAQVAALGAVAASVFFPDKSSLLLAASFPFLAAVGTALALARLEKRTEGIQEALIGSLFVVSACLSILLVASDPHGGDAVENLLSGQILWAGWRDVGMLALIYAPVLFVLLQRQDWAQRFFYIIFALSITLSVQVVGVYLVFATLILPALATINRPIGWAYAVAGLALVSGLAFSVLTDLPAGPVLVCAYAASAAVFTGVFLYKSKAF